MASDDSGVEKIMIFSLYIGISLNNGRYDRDYCLIGKVACGLSMFTKINDLV